MAGPAAAAVPATVTWHVHPAGRPGSVNLAGGPAAVTVAASSRYALDYLAPTDLRAAVSAVNGRVVADVPPGAGVALAVRGWYRTGWGEWRGVPARLGAPTRRVQVRLVLSAASAGPPVVHDVVLTGTPGPAQPSPATRMQYQVFATREGLVGRVTADGHTITAHDHFVSLPSWSALSPRDSGDYSVRACAGGRCAYEPVWDVGPWNTHDDYWNASREQWRDLPAGTPEAQAAFQRGYNGGRDQYGRTVLNPAGLDLADGALWDDLRLAGNAWVSVTYLWTGGGTQAQVVTDGDALNVRAGPGTGYASVGLAGRYTRVPVECQTAGQTITGPAGTSRLWDRIGPGNYVSHAYLQMNAGVTVARC